MSSIGRFFRNNKYIITVSNKGIKSKKIGSLSRVTYFVVYVWIAFTSVFFFFGIKSQKYRLAEIERLKIDNHELTGRIAEMEGIIEDFGDYFRILNYYDRFDKFKTGKFAATVEKNKNKIIAKEKTRGNMKSMTTSVEENLSLVNQALKLRTDSISNTLKIASLDRKIAQNSHEHNGDVNSALRQSIKRLNSLESFLNSIPIVRPMDNYRVSSHYGLRLDPFDKVKRMHRGIDLVGPYKSKIFVPADGIVRFVSKNKKLGNTVVVYHGNDIVTKYGHLGDIYVSVGDQVKKGDVLAVQGNTGRSTGNHLHYEISVNNINQDPNDFFKIGDKLGIQLDLGKLLNKNSTSAGNSKNVKYNIVVPADRKY